MFNVVVYAPILVIFGSFCCSRCALVFVVLGVYEVCNVVISGPVLVVLGS